MSIRKRATVVLIFAFICFTLGARSQPSSDLILKIGGGVSVPIEKPGIYNRDAGYNLNIGAGYLIKRNFGLRIDLDYDLFRDPVSRGVSTQPDNPRFYMTSLKLGFTAGLFKRKTKLKPYAIAGFGFHYLTKLRTDLEVLQDSEIDFSAFAGGGLFITFAKEGGFYVESEYQRFFSSDRLISNIPIRIGLVYCPGK